jgi:hypothetical protein
MNTLLLVLIGAKAICLFICWKGISMANKQNKKGNEHATKDTNHAALQGSQEELHSLQQRMNNLMEQNEKVRKEISTMKK